MPKLAQNTGRRKANSQLYRIKTVEEAKKIAYSYLKEHKLEKVVSFGLPEIDDRYNIWRVPLLSKDGERIGEATKDALISHAWMARI